ncbi:hypothetical protein BDV95DRAFT_214491 [Massariosphaeria phaeospora]|uniref:Uncharacterized protein n=1 Tax=Massariosphaeria phaeospora TaxID=100035 RepID=A0A7C8M2Z8_9PLEO|nr:hypothetical protein BDV95DRAFT_214491 [Massariosphaeria phaeospora]
MSQDFIYTAKCKSPPDRLLREDAGFVFITLLLPVQTPYAYITIYYLPSIISHPAHHFIHSTLLCPSSRSLPTHSLTPAKSSTTTYLFSLPSHPISSHPIPLPKQNRQIMIDASIHFIKLGRTNQDSSTYSSHLISSHLISSYFHLISSHFRLTNKQTSPTTTTTATPITPINNLFLFPFAFCMIRFSAFVSKYPCIYMI